LNHLQALIREAIVYNTEKKSAGQEESQIEKGQKRLK